MLPNFHRYLAPLEGIKGMSTRLALAAGVVLAFACGASGAYWGMRLTARPRPVPADALRTGLPDVGALAAAAPNLFGQAGPAPKAEMATPRFRLWGVIGGGSAAGAALIGVDGQAPRAVAVGAPVTPGVQLRSTAFGRAVLNQGGGEIELKVQPDSAGAAATRVDAPAGLQPAMRLPGPPPMPSAPRPGAPPGN